MPSPAVLQVGVCQGEGHAVDGELQIADPQRLPQLTLHILLKVHPCKQAQQCVTNSEVTSHRYTQS